MMSQQEFQLVERLTRALESNAAATNKLADAIAKAESILDDISSTVENIDYKTADHGEHR